MFLDRNEFSVSLSGRLNPEEPLYRRINGPDLVHTLKKTHISAENPTPVIQLVANPFDPTRELQRRSERERVCVCVRNRGADKSSHPI